MYVYKINHLSIHAFKIKSLSFNSYGRQSNCVKKFEMTPLQFKNLELSKRCPSFSICD